MRAEVYGSAASQSPTDKFIVVGGVSDSSYIVASLFHTPRFISGASDNFRPFRTSTP